MNKNYIDIGELRQTEFPAPVPLASPWLNRGNLVMLHARSGVGKTYLALGLSQAIASGSRFLGWTTSQARVLYYDCEMGLRALKERFAKLDACAAFEAPPDMIRLTSYRAHMNGIPWNLAELDGQKLINPMLKDVKFIVIDNLSDAVKQRDNEREFIHAWRRFRTWLLKVRDAGKTVLLVHHSGKNDTQRGITQIEDVQDVILKLRWPEGWCPAHGTKFELRFQKGRELEAEAQKELLVSITKDERGHLKWFVEPLIEANQKRKAQSATSIEQFSDDDLPF